MEDLIMFQAEVETREVARVLAAGAVLEIPAIVATVWQTGIEKARQAIKKYTNQKSQADRLYEAASRKADTRSNLLIDRLQEKKDGKNKDRGPVREF